MFSLFGLFLTANLLCAQCVHLQDVSASISGQPPKFGKMIYHAALHRMLAYEDLILTPAHVFAAYDAAAWTSLPQPDFPARSTSAWIYDSTRNVGLLFGGVGNNAPELWSYDGNWHQLTWPGTSPPRITGGPWGTFDPIRGRAIFIFETSRTAVLEYETWEWTGSGWEQGPNLGSFSPDLNFVFDPSRNIGFIAGEEPNSCQEAVWFYRPGPTAAQGAWEKQTVTGDFFQSRFGTTLAYDPNRHRVFRCYGVYDHSCSDNVTTGYVPFIDTWNFAASTWNRATEYSFPSDNYRRATELIAFDSDRDRLVVAGGFRRDNVNGSIETTDYHDTWEMSSDEPGLLSSSQGTSIHCEGDNAVFAMSAAGANLSYEWFHNAVLIPGAASSVFFRNNLAAADGGNYVGRVKNDCGYVDTPIIRLQVKAPIAIARPAVFPDCSLTCQGSDVSIFPPDPRDLSLNMHLQKWLGSWVDVRVSTPSAPTNFVFRNVQKSFTGNYRFYIDGSPCDGLADSEHFIQVGFDITHQPVSLTNVAPCSSPTFKVGFVGGCSVPAFYWFKDNFEYLNDNGHFVGTHTDTLRIDGVRYENEGSYYCLLVDTNQCYTSEISLAATLRLRPAQWVLRSNSGPPPRYGHAMAYDNARSVTMLFGGGRLSDDHSRNEDFGDLWEWNGAAWRQRTTSSVTSGWAKAIGTGYWYPAYDVPVPRRQHAMAYDSNRHRLVMFGGRGDTPDGFDAFLGDTWEWDGLAWQLRATNGPSTRVSHSMAYDTSRGVTVLYGGFGAVAPGLVWEWNGNSWASNAPATGPSPNYSQDAAAMTYLESRHRIFFGPTTDGFSTRFFWNWNGSAWSSEEPGFTDLLVSPPYGAMVYDTYRQRPVFFGGENGYANFFGGNTTASYELGSGQARSEWTLLPDVASTSLFATNDFIAPAIVVQIRQRTDTLSDFIWNQLTGPAQQTLANSSSTIESQISVLRDAFNQIVSGPSIYVPARFSGVPLSAETLAFQSINPRGPDLIRFNRLLLEDYYPAALAKSPSTPPGRMRHAMAFDSRRHATVLFGGLYDPSSLQLDGNETWELLTFDNPIINEQPASQYRQAGQFALFQVAARAPAAAPLTYQWFFNDLPLNDAGRISGAHQSTLTIANVIPSDEGQYKVRVSDDCGFTDSFAALLTLNAGLQIFSTANALTLIWSDENVVLQQADSVNGPWTPVSGAISPFDVASAGPAKFFRLQPAAP